MALFLIATESLSAQAPAQARIQGPIDDTQLVRLRGNTHPLARAEYDQGAAPADLPAQHMVILLSRTPDRDAALEKFLGEQQDRSSPSYMKWLTPAEFGDKFGPAEADVSAVTAWLAQQGFTVERVSAGKMAIEFSGDAARVQRAFHTAIHQYVVNGRQYWANADDPEIPAALATVVRGVVSLNDFPRKPLSRTFGLFRRQADGTVTPEYTGQSSSGSYYAVGPGDFAAIYNTTPLLQAGNNGAGQTIALLGVSNVHLSDIASFRSIFNLGTGDTSVVIDGPDPGIVAGAEGESVLDLEWSSAVAPGAKVMLVSAQDTVTTSGLDLAALHVIDNNLAGVMSVSYGYCEAGLGTTENQYIQSLWQQAAAQGITVLVSAGDSGSAGCDYQSSTKIAQHGLAVNGLASTAYNVAVGGTDFNDVGSQSTYWNTTNDPTTRTSAKGYIPEMTWNSTCAATATLANPSVCPVMPSSGTPAAGSGLQILAASGGPSSCTVSTATSGSVQCQGGRAKPAWQSGTGVPADGVRDLPDVSLFAAVSSSSNSFYMVCQSDTQYGAVCQPGSSFSFFAVGGTSASAAAFAGIVALAEQKAGTRLGNLNPLLYSLAAQTGASCRTSSSGGSACMFNDVVSGNIAVPCTAGTPNCSASSGSTTGVEVDATGAPAYAAGTGYDLATGLGTVNVTNLVNGIASAVKNAAATSVALTLNGSQAAVTATHGDSIGVAVSVTPAASSGTVSLLGKSGGIDSGSLSSGAAAWNSRMFPGGSYTVTARYPGDATHAASDSNGISVTISPEASQTLLSLVTFDAQGQPIFGAASTPYGSPYVLHGEVADAAATVSAAGVSSTCSKQTASCPTGKVALTSNGSALDGGSFTLNSKGYFEDWQIQLPAGSYTISGSYPGDASYLSNTGTAAVTISKAPTTLTANKAPLGDVPYGSPTQVNAFVTTHSSGSAPTGVYNWFEDGAATTEVVQSGAVDARAGIGTTSASATYYGWYVPGTLGAHSLYAQYSGDADYMGADSSAAPFAVTVVKTGTWANSYGVLPNIALPTTQVTLTISVGSTSVLAEPTGTVTFSDNGNPVNGTVSYSGHAGSGTNYDASLQAQLKATFATGTHTIT
ncbi:MAG: protease pro-enzyme activation domain-containing protein, partial [Terriglobales bacterium]